MNRPDFDARELDVIGENPSFMPGFVPGAPIFNRPITPRENLKLMPESAAKDEIRGLAKEFVDKYDGCRVALQFDEQSGIPLEEIYNQDFLDAVYEFSRKAYRGAD